MKGMLKGPRLGVIVGLAILVALASVMLAGAAGKWSSLAPIPAGLGPGESGNTEGMTVGQVGNNIIAAYGHDPFVGDTNTTRIYDIDADSWSAGPPAPLPPRAELAYGDTTHGGMFYAIGGRGCATPTGVCDNLEQYDPAAASWTTLAPMPTARAGLAAAVVGNAIYAIGGRTATGGPCSQWPPFTTELATVERYDIDHGVWTTVASLPSPRSDLGAIAHGGKIYVFGGCQIAPMGIDNDGDGLVDEDDFDGLDNDGDTLIDEDPPEFAPVFLSDVDVYNPVTDTWSTAPTDMPTARASLVVGKVGNRAYAMGGWAGGPPLSVNEVYNIAKDGWATDTAMITGRGEAGVASHGGRIYVVGGALPAFGSSVNVNEVFKP